MSISTIFIPKGYKAVEIFKSNNPDDIGEALRQWCFVSRNLEQGCYETFELARFFNYITPPKHIYKILRDSDNSKIYCAKYNHRVLKEFKKYDIEGKYSVIVAWVWNGDGTLYFEVKNKDGKIVKVINRDCKKDYGWRFVK